MPPARENAQLNSTATGADRVAVVRSALLFLRAVGAGERQTETAQPRSW